MDKSIERFEERVDFDVFKFDVFKKPPIQRGLEDAMKFPDFHWKQVSPGKWIYNREGGNGEKK